MLSIFSVKQGKMLCGAIAIYFPMALGPQPSGIGYLSRGEGEEERMWF
jgi:hypothetical protein